MNLVPQEAFFSSPFLIRGFIFVNGRKKCDFEWVPICNRAFVLLAFLGI